MYKGRAFSPATVLKNNIGAADTVIEVDDVSVFPEAPNYATLGTEYDNAETIIYNAVTENSLSECIRGIEGEARTWNAGTQIGRNFTNADYEAMCENIENSVQKGMGNADNIQFSDGETFQEKYNSGELKGEKGDTGNTGEKGDTPEKGVDYYTNSDKEEMVNAVIEAMPDNRIYPDTLELALDGNGSMTLMKRQTDTPDGVKTVLNNTTADNILYDVNSTIKRQIEDKISQTSVFSGDVTGTYDNIELAEIAAAGTMGESEDRVLDFGGSFRVLEETIDKKGRTTAVSERTMTLPAKPCAGIYDTVTELNGDAGAVISVAVGDVQIPQGEKIVPGQTLISDAGYSGAKTGGTLGRIEGYADEPVDSVFSVKIISPSRVIEMTYDELKALKENSELVSGQKYLLTNYRTKYKMPYIDVIKEVDEIEPLLLEASSANTFSPIASSSAYPHDVIYYDFDDNVCEDDTTPRNGFIRRRVDTEYNVDVPQDWRNMVWGRYKATARIWEGESIFPVGYYQSGNNIYEATGYGTPSSATDEQYFTFVCTTDDYYWIMDEIGLTLDTSDYLARYTFNADTDPDKKTATKSDTIFPENMVIEGTGSKKTLHNNIFCFSTASDRPGGNWFALGCCDNTFKAGSCHGNMIGAGFSNNESTGSFNYNTLGSICSSNKFKGAFSHNTVGSRCWDNEFGSGFSTNTIGSYFWNNKLGNSCHTNTFGSGCHGNTFGDSCYQNTLGSRCCYSKLGNNCRYNFFGSNSAGHFGDDCMGNKLDNYCLVILGTGCNFNSFGSYCNNISFNDNSKYNTVEPGVSTKNMSGIAELHNKTYNHRIFKNSAGAVYSVHYVNTTPTYTSIP